MRNTPTPAHAATLPQLGQPWPETPGTYAGLIHTPEGLHHLVLLDEAPSQRMEWADAMAWAKGLDADLPSRVEALTIFKNLPGKVEAFWHWTNEQYAGGESYAWYQYFGTGDQVSTRKSYEGRVRAVRRFPIDPSILFGGAQ
jgi:hypothetical protein